MDIYLLTLGILVILAIVDLTVGVANDAVNFLNSAIGANVAKLKVILIIAALGVLVGVLISGGMMEVARKGVFNPEQFFMPELLIIFVSVMFLDILLLDTFNTFGLPTSTTVSIFFGLFGSGLAMTLIKIWNTTGDLAEIGIYMNTGKSLTIIGAIFVSIVFAFIFGLLIQYITRLIFSFDFRERFNKFGAFWGAAALAAISFFAVIKGAKNAPFMTKEMSEFILNNIPLVIGYSYIFWTVILFIIIRFTKFDALKFIVLVGTFALAMAFAANDLVNFIGAPVAALTAYDFAQGAADPAFADMSPLQGKLPTPTWILLISGIIMVITLFLSKKARSVSKTEISLGRQEEGFERFESNAVARAIVRMFHTLFTEVRKIVPAPFQRLMRKRFDTTHYKPETDNEGNIPAFDLLRAAVILFVASALISTATLLKLPLSTTYVTFIVAMAAALPDKAWGRDSAVYRVSGVLTVVGGWFITALFATLGAMIICFIIYYGGIFGLIGIFALTAYSVYRSTKYHKQAEEKIRIEEEKLQKELQTKSASNQKVLNDIGEFVVKVADTFVKANEGLISEDLKVLKKSKKHSNKIEKNILVVNSDIIKMINKYDSEESEYANLAVRMTISLQDMSDKLYHSVSQNYKYVNNNHAALSGKEAEQLTELNTKLSEFVEKIRKSLSELDFDHYEELKSDYLDLVKYSSKLYKKQLKRVKKHKSTVRKSIVILNLISDFEIQTELIFKVYEFSKLSRAHV